MESFRDLGYCVWGSELWSCRLLCVGRDVWYCRELCMGRQVWRCSVLCVGPVVEIKVIMWGETGVDL